MIGRAENKAAVLQLSTKSHSVIIHLIHVFRGPLQKQFYNCIQSFLGCTSVVFSGIGIFQDCEKLSNDWNLEVSTRLDLDELCGGKFRPSHGGSWGIKSLSKKLFNIDIYKPKKIQCGNWEKFPLNDRQVYYAAQDSYLIVCLYDTLLKVYAGELIANAIHIEPLSVEREAKKKIKALLLRKKRAAARKRRKERTKMKQNQSNDKISH